MRILCPTQDSQEWFSARVGRVTASCCHDAMKFVWKGSKERGDKRMESSAVRNNYISELAWGLITRVPIEHFVSKEMDLGKAWESRARAEYQYLYSPDEDVEQTGFVLHPTLDYLGGSPDGLLTNGGVELKVHKFKIHKEYLETGIVCPEYEAQVYCNMLCCEKEWWDFASYCPAHEDFGYEAVSVPTEFRMFRKRYTRNDEIFQQIEEGATRAIEEAIALAEDLRRRYPKRAEKPVPEQQWPADLTSDAYRFVDSINTTP